MHCDIINHTMEVCVYYNINSKRYNLQYNVIFINTHSICNCNTYFILIYIYIISCFFFQYYIIVTIWIVIKLNITILFLRLFIYTCDLKAFEFLFWPCLTVVIYACIMLSYANFELSSLLH